MATAQLTMLNSMAGRDFGQALAAHREWGLEWLDLRDEIYGHWVAALDVETARRAKGDIDEAGLAVYCLSTGIFFEDIEKGEPYFREKHLAMVDHVADLAKVLQPQVVRLIAAQLPSRGDDQSAMHLIEREHSWLLGVYREAIDRLADRGLRSTIENEAFRCFLTRPEDFLRFFAALDRPDSTCLTWDVQNHWATGAFPSAEVYEQLRPLIGYYHVKGGQADGGSNALAWNVALEDASWPVADLTQRVVDHGVSPVICLNPPQHGKQKPGYDYSDIVARDLAFLRANVKGVK